MGSWEENTDALRGSVRAGGIVSLLLTAGLALYFALVPDLENRGVILAIDVVVALTAVVVLKLPIERMVERRLVFPFFAAWSVTVVVLASLAVIVVDDPTSPLTAVFFLPMIFAAIAYPLRLVMLITALVVAAVVVTLALVDQGLPEIILYTFIIVSAAALCVFQAQAHERHLQEVERLSRTDYLTGCLNRRGFEDELGKRLARYQRYGTPMGLVLLDLDRFKAVNDAEGHTAGDALLRTVSGTISETIRATDNVSRVGGDEFAVLLEQSDGVTAQQVADRIVEALRPHCDVSVGWACVPGDAEEAEDVYRQADTRLYESKSLRGAVR
jgi:diguanylate cyclase (GGDEF)-like protein